jgi:hypothetical protein
MNNDNFVSIDEVNKDLALLNSWKESVKQFKTDNYDYTTTAKHVVDYVTQNYLNGNALESMTIHVTFSGDDEAFVEEHGFDSMTLLLSALNNWCIPVYEQEDDVVYYLRVLDLIAFHQNGNIDLYFSDNLVDAISCISDMESLFNDM